MDSQRNLAAGDAGRRERIRTFIAGLNNLEIASESVTELSSGYVRGPGLDGVFLLVGMSKLQKLR
jgi:hypothetical protein